MLFRFRMKLMELLAGGELVVMNACVNGKNVKTGKSAISDGKSGSFNDAVITPLKWQKEKNNG